MSALRERAYQSTDGERKPASSARAQFHIVGSGCHSSLSRRRERGRVRVEKLPEHLVLQARRLRRQQTDAEALLWSLLRRRGLGGHKFRRQHSVPPYIVDFYCAEERLVVEVDGGQHAECGNRARDGKRSQALELAGMRVIRFWNTEVLHETEGVVAAPWQVLECENPPSP